MAGRLSSMVTKLIFGFEAVNTETSSISTIPISSTIFRSFRLMQNTLTPSIRFPIQHPHRLHWGGGKVKDYTN